MKDSTQARRAEQLLNEANAALFAIELQKSDQPLTEASRAMALRTRKAINTFLEELRHRGEF